MIKHEWKSAHQDVPSREELYNAALNPFKHMR